MSEPSMGPLDGDRIQVIQTSGLPPYVIPPSAALIPPGGEPYTSLPAPTVDPLRTYLNTYRDDFDAVSNLMAALSAVLDLCDAPWTAARIVRRVIARELGVTDG